MEIALIALVIFLDQLTKFYIQSHPVWHGKVEMIPGFLYLTYVKNTGAAWSILSGRQLFLILVAVVETAVLIYVLIKARKNQKKLMCVSVSLMIGGALGNLADRLLFGYVRDFIDTYPLGYDFPVFNVADAALCIGVALLILDMILEERKTA